MDEGVRPVVPELRTDVVGIPEWCDADREALFESDELARRENVCCKGSGMVTEARWNEWSEADFKPYLDVVLDAFGPERLMYGSDWPVCLLSADYGPMKSIADGLAAELSPDEQAAFYGANAIEFYGLHHVR